MILTPTSIMCINCGIPFWVTEGHKEVLQRNHESFYCPKGHGQHFTERTEAEKYRSRLDAEERYSKELQKEVNDLQKEIKSLKRKKRRKK